MKASTKKEEQIVAAASRRPSRKALKQARSAEHLGARRKAAETAGPVATLAVAVDQLRSSIAQLPESKRPQAAEKAIRMLDELRETITES